VAGLLRRGVEPGIGEAADCTYATPDGCTALAASYVRFPAHRVLPDEPIAGPALRWDWETGTTFAFGPLTVEGSVSPGLVAAIGTALGRVHVAGPFEGTNGDPGRRHLLDSGARRRPRTPDRPAVLLAIRRRRAR
jgi:hypothetical protein